MLLFSQNWSGSKINSKLVETEGGERLYFQSWILERILLNFKKIENIVQFLLFLQGRSDNDYGDTQHNDIKLSCFTHHKDTQYNIMLIVTLFIDMLSVVSLNACIQCHFIGCYNTECNDYTECRNTECRFTDICYSE